MKKYFNKGLIMSALENEEFERSNICWLCGKLIDFDVKVRDLCHISGKYRKRSRWKCNINLKISKKLFVIFHNLRGCDSQRAE